MHSNLMPIFFLNNVLQIFTDAGQYVIRFGSSDPNSKSGPAEAVMFHIRG